MATNVQPSVSATSAGDLPWWVEKTIVQGRPDRVSGEYALGKAMVSPQCARNGADIYHFMRDVKPGDVILHLTDNQAFTLISRAASSYRESPGLPGTPWPGPAYLVQVTNAQPLTPPLSREVFFSPPCGVELDRLVRSGIKNLFYEPRNRLHQGAFLTPLPPQVRAALSDAYRGLSGRSLEDDVPGSVDEDHDLTAAIADIEALEAEERYVEGTRSNILINKYERDPRLRMEAIRIHGTTCSGCGFSFDAFYGARGAGYIEVHHLKPLSSYGGAVVVDPDTDLTVVCANCHRMIHRRTQDPLTVEQLRRLIDESGGQLQPS